jgi:hypothetical protein
MAFRVPAGACAGQPGGPEYGTATSKAELAIRLYSWSLATPFLISGQSAIPIFKEDCGQVAFAGLGPFRLDWPLRKNGRTFDNWDIQRFAPGTSALRVARLGVIERENWRGK